MESTISISVYVKNWKTLITNLLKTQKHQFDLSFFEILKHMNHLYFSTLFTWEGYSKYINITIRR